jgi:hypothetical protein
LDEVDESATGSLNLFARPPSAASLFSRTAPLLVARPPSAASLFSRTAPLRCAFLLENGAPVASARRMRACSSRARPRSGAAKAVAKTGNQDAFATWLRPFADT